MVDFPKLVEMEGSYATRAMAVLIVKAVISPKIEIFRSFLLLIEFKTIEITTYNQTFVIENQILIGFYSEILDKVVVL